jgi:hypothetical protein
MKLQIRYILVAVALCICSSSLALGASVTITSSGGGSFAVQGDNLNGVHGMDLTIGYDTSVLSSPSVSWGSLVSGALSMANTTTIPGTVKIAIIRTDHSFSGSGPIATLSFATQGSSAGITSVSVKMIDDLGRNVPAQAMIAPGAAGTATAAADPALIANPGVPFSQTATPSVSTTAPATAAPTASAGLGVVNIPGDLQPKNDMQHAESAAAQPPVTSEGAERAAQQISQAPAEMKAETAEPVDVKKTVYQSVLDRFRTYQGEKKPENLMALFSKTVSSYIRQEPAIAVSNGKATLRVTIDLSAVKGTSTSFALTGAKLVSLKKEDNSDTWVLDAQPQENSLKATVTILNSRSVIEFPLTVVPPSAAVSVKQTDFAAFLNDSGVKAPKHDLNGDGRHDYVDDFIYTAHYLITVRAAAEKTK